MKRLLLTALLATLLSAGYAQPAKISYGLHAGLNMSNLHSENSGIVSKYTIKPGLNAGIEVWIPLCSHFSLQPGLDYAQMGARYQAGETPRLSYKENYLALPLLVNYQVAKSGLAVYLGPQVAYLLNASSENKEGTTLSVAGYATKYDFSGIVGCGYYLQNGLGLSARYQKGLINVAQKAYLGSDGSVKNNGFSILLGYRF
ncbi:Outer membrane protein beta-barrel domain-containing protein [Arachidicoccus rhizosphaerae]|uniref:Outer membrane protein beta-barrel domain-containing protein n=1 Tax=Arachidicoccus rhizosphaerae TaxID=551991 RepID=A0A1H4C9L0_9BACT|nr:porin family protein [Arachidicoccus rhizosphaerae]SEA57046.1 Outer membrane protein beta-barrel domain-containing protein [Arachidicoccus rhizosphaerae]